MGSKPASLAACTSPDARTAGRNAPIRAVMAVFLGLSLLITAGLPVAAQRGPASVADTAEKLQDAVVNISTTQKVKDNREVPMPDVPKGAPFDEFFRDYFDRQDKDGGNQRANSLGSGFIIDPSGLVVTNNHVIEGADEITVVLTNGSKLKVVKVLGRDTKTDLALLKVEPKTPLKAVKFGESQKMRVGDWVMAIGNPFGLGGTVTVGVISATRRDINAGLYDEFLQTDAAINRGNSGGPLFNMDGEVIGVNTAIISPTGGSIGIGFAMPSSTVVNVIEQLKQFGETRRGWLGVRIQTINEEIAESLGLKEAGGALVANVSPDGPAAAAGVQVGDVIVKFDGQEINAMRQLPKLVAQTQVDKEVEVIILRKGERKTFKIKVARMEEGEVKPAAPGAGDKNGKPQKPNKRSELGITLAAITDEIRSRYDIEAGVQGVVVTDVDPDSPLAEKEIHAGTIIVEVTHQKVASPDQIKERLHELRKLNRKSALLLVSDAHGEMNFVAVKLIDE